MDLLKTVFTHFTDKYILKKPNFIDNMIEGYNDKNTCENSVENSQSSIISTHSVDTNDNKTNSTYSKIDKTKESSTKDYDLDVIESFDAINYSVNCTKTNEKVEINNTTHVIDLFNIYISNMAQGKEIERTSNYLKEFDEVLLKGNDKNNVHYENEPDSKVTLDVIDDYSGNLNESIKNYAVFNAPNDDLSTETLNLNLFNSKTEEIKGPVTNYANDLLEDKNTLFDVSSINSTKGYLNNLLTCKNTVDVEKSVSFEDIKLQEETSDSDCSGYHSSDFEFISENEAILDGLIIHANPKETNSSSSTVKVKVTRNLKYDKNYSQFASRVAKPSRPNFEVENSCRDNHIVPEGEDYINLFRGIYNPVLPASAMYFLENKSIRSSTCMLVEYQGMDFNMQIDRHDEEFKHEANESAKKILSMYPGENRKRRRRF